LLNRLALPPSPLRHLNAISLLWEIEMFTRNTAMNDREFAPIQTEWDDRSIERAVDEAIALKLTSVRKSSMKLGPYNGFGGEVRVIADLKIKGRPQVAVDFSPDSMQRL
jgi:hypothetical protein